MDNINIVVIGGSAAGITAATRIKRVNDNANVTIIEESSDIGYSIPALPDFTSQNITNINSIHTGTDDQLSGIYKINILQNSKALEINNSEKFVLYKSYANEKNEKIKYDKLILATGTKSIIPKPFNPNTHNIFCLKNIHDSQKIVEYIKKTAADDVVILGLNYYSLLLVSSLIKKGYKISIISNNENIDDFDIEFAQIIKNELLNNNVTLYLNKTIKKLVYLDRTIVNEIKLSDDTAIKSNVIINMELFLPNLDLIKHTGILLSPSGKIKVNNKLQTSDPDIYAVGNIVDTINSVTGQSDSADLLNQVLLQARIAGSNAAGMNFTYNGFIRNKLLKIDNLYIGYTGLSTIEAQKYYPNSMTVTIFSSNSERFLPNSKQLHLKLIFNKSDRKILGYQISGYDKGIDKRLDAAYLTLYSNLTIDDLVNLNFSYNPGVSLYRDPLNILGMMAENLFTELSNPLGLSNFYMNQDYFIVDIRNNNDYKKSHLENSICIPLDELRKNTDKIPKDKTIIIYSYVGRKGYIAERILKSNGFQNVFNIEGGMSSIKLFENI
jgi:NADPH-dependent 2,4-dienoyl-CoA reductase/sulfur reductase-like enzyme/rhodanese-related sulfurtransferase